MRSIVRAGVIVVFALSVIGLSCPGATLAASIQIAVNNTMPGGGSEEHSIRRFKELVEQKSQGQMVVTPYLGGQLGGEVSVLSLLKIGKTEMALTGSDFLAQYAAEYNAAGIPYLMTWEEESAFLGGPFGAKIAELCQKKGGLVYFGPQYRGPRQMTSNRPIREAKDLKGLKIRLPENPVWIRVWKELGVLPVALPATEIYMAMQTGQVEAHENSLASPYSRSLWEVQKFIILTSHIYETWSWVASDVWFRKLTGEQQKIIREATEEARKYGEKVEREKDVFYLEELKKKGMTIITPDVESIKRAARPAMIEEIKRLHPDVQKVAMQYIPK